MDKRLVELSTLYSKLMINVGKCHNPCVPHLPTKRRSPFTYKKFRNPHNKTHTKSISFKDKGWTTMFLSRVSCVSGVDWKQQLTTSIFVVYRMSETLIEVIARKLRVYVMLCVFFVLACFYRKRLLMNITSSY